MKIYIENNYDGVTTLEPMGDWDFSPSIGDKLSIVGINRKLIVTGKEFVANPVEVGGLYAKLTVDEIVEDEKEKRFFFFGEIHDSVKSLKSLFDDVFTASVSRSEKFIKRANSLEIGESIMTEEVFYLIRLK